MTKTSILIHARDIVAGAISRGELVPPDPDAVIDYTRIQREKTALKKDDKKSRYYIPPFIHSIQRTLSQ